MLARCSGSRCASRRADAELALAELLALAPSGVEEVGAAGDVVEYAVYGAARRAARAARPAGRRGRRAGRGATTEVADDWDERWRAFHQPIDASAAALHVRPPWEAAGAGRASRSSIDPGQAFGTGAHATTRLCLELLLELEPDGPLRRRRLRLRRAGDRRARARAGSRCGARPRPRVGGGDRGQRRRQRRRTSRSGARPAHDGPVPTAPTSPPTCCARCCSHRRGRLHGEPPPDALIASGLLAHEADEVAAAFAAHGLREAARRLGGEWAALLLRRGVSRR